MEFNMSYYFLAAGAFSALQTADNACDPVVVPEEGQFVGLALAAAEAIDAAATIDIVKNGSDTAADDGTAADVQVPAASANTGQICYTDKKVHVQPGDRLTFTSNGEPTGAAVPTAVAIFRR